MDVPLISSLEHWHNFYALTGESAATLVGLMFVAVSIGAGVFTHDNQVGTRAFFSPTVVHFSEILIVSLIATLPDETWSWCAGLLIITGGVGLGYCAWIWRRMIRHGFMGTIDRIDRFWYAQLPIVSYLLVIGAGAGLYRHIVMSLDLLGFALIALLVVGLRNSWDLTLWIIGRRFGE